MRALRLVEIVGEFFFYVQYSAVVVSPDGRPSRLVRFPYWQAFISFRRLLVPSTFKSLHFGRLIAFSFLICCPVSSRLFHASVRIDDCVSVNNFLGHSVSFLYVRFPSYNQFNAGLQAVTGNRSSVCDCVKKKCLEFCSLFIVLAESMSVFERAGEWIKNCSYGITDIDVTSNCPS